MKLSTRNEYYYITSLCEKLDNPKRRAQSINFVIVVNRLGNIWERGGGKHPIALN